MNKRGILRTAFFRKFIPLRNKNKKGISMSVVVILLTLITIILLMILFTLIGPTIKESPEETQIEKQRITIFSHIDKNSLCLSPDKLGLEIERSAGEGDIEALYFILRNQTSEYNHTEPIALKLNERTRITLLLSGKISSLKEIELYSIIKTSRGNLLGSIKDNYKIKGTEISCEPLLPFNFFIFSPKPNQKFFFSNPVFFNLSTSKKADCNFSIDNHNQQTMSSSDSLFFSESNKTLEKGMHNVSFTCQSEENETLSSLPILFSRGGILITACTTLNESNEFYILDSNISSPNTCLIINASNITIFGSGNTITYGSSSAPNSNGIYISSNENILMQDLTINEGIFNGINKHGLLIKNSQNITIRNSGIAVGSQSSSSIYLYESQKIVIENNRINAADTRNNGIRLVYTNESQIRSNIINLSERDVAKKGQSEGHGMKLETSFSNLIENNVIITRGDQNFGIFMLFSGNNIFRSNRILTGGTNSIVIFGDQENHFTSNSIDSTNLAEEKPINYTTGPVCNNLVIDSEDFTGKGEVIFAHCTNVTIKNSKFNLDGINFFHTVNSTIKNNTFLVTKGYSIFLYSNSNNNVIQNNTILALSEYGHGIFILSSSSNQILGNSIETNADRSRGVYTAYSSLNTISSNNITTRERHSHGIQFFATSLSKLENNRISIIGAHSPLTLSPGHGIFLDYSDSNTIDKNTITTEGLINYGISLEYSSHIVLKENLVNSSRSNSIVILGDNANGGFNHSIDTSNKVEGFPVFYTEGNNCSGKTFTEDYSEYGQVIFANCTSLTVQSSKLSHDSLNLFFVRNSFIKDNPITSSTGHGIFLYSSSIKNEILNNNIITTSEASGSIMLERGDSSKNLIKNNIITSSNYGIYLRTNENLIHENTMTTSFYGIFIGDSGNNITKNQINPAPGGYDLHFMDVEDTIIDTGIDIHSIFLDRLDRQTNRVVLGSVANINFTSSSSGYLHIKKGVDITGLNVFFGGSSRARLTVNAHALTITSTPSGKAFTIIDNLGTPWYSEKTPITLYLGEKYYNKTGDFNPNPYTLNITGCSPQSFTLNDDSSISC